MKIPSTLSARMENHPEAIYHIVAEKQTVRAKDIAQRLDVNNSSVTMALRTLAVKGLINHVPYDGITLTAERKKVSEDVIQRHEALRSFFTLSGSGEPTLNSGIGWIIKEIKKISDTPVAVLTNGTHLALKSMRGEVSRAEGIHEECGTPDSGTPRAAPGYGA